MIIMNTLKVVNDQWSRRSYLQKQASLTLDKVLKRISNQASVDVESELPAMLKFQLHFWQLNGSKTRIVDKGQRQDFLVLIELGK
jgi:hypothetical protein